jgi:hypothetical protein
MYAAVTRAIAATQQLVSFCDAIIIGEQMKPHPGGSTGYKHGPSSLAYSFEIVFQNEEHL